MVICCRPSSKIKKDSPDIQDSLKNLLVAVFKQDQPLHPVSPDQKIDGIGSQIKFNKEPDNHAKQCTAKNGVWSVHCQSNSIMRIETSLGRK